jgi:hypothetical protein
LTKKPYLVIILCFSDSLDEAVEVADDLLHPALSVTLRQSLQAHLGNDPDASANNGSLTNKMDWILK